MSHQLLAHRSLTLYTESQAPILVSNVKLITYISRNRIESSEPNFGALLENFLLVSDVLPFTFLADSRRMPEPYTGALNGNWVEERWKSSPTFRAEWDVSPKSSPKVGDHAAKWGPELRIESPSNQASRGMPASILFSKEPGASYSQSLNTLTLKGSARGTHEPKVQSYLFGSGNRSDLSVPRTGYLSPYATSPLATTKSLASKANLSAATQGFSTSSRSSALQAATLSASASPKTSSTIRPQSSLSDTSFVGRKVSGQFASECTKNFRVIGLRDTYHSTLTTLKL